MASSPRLSIADQLCAAFGRAIPSALECMSAKAALDEASRAISIRDYTAAEKFFTHAYEQEPSEKLAIRIAHFFAFHRRDGLTAEGWFKKAYDFRHDAHVARYRAFLRNKTQ